MTTRRSLRDPASLDPTLAGEVEPVRAAADDQRHPTARRAFIASVVVLAVLVSALVLWELRLLVCLVFLSFTIAAAMRPGVEGLRSRGVPRGAGVALHYLGLLGLLALLLWLVVPHVLHEIQQGLGNLPEKTSELRSAAREATGLKQQLLLGIQKRLEELPSRANIMDPALSVTLGTIEILLGIFFTLACAAYWIFERTLAERLILSLVPLHNRKVVHDTWNLIDLKLGAYVRGQGLLITLVGVVLSFTFWVIGLPYYLLLGILAGILETIPVLGPITAGVVVVGIGLTVSWKIALAAGLAVLVVRLVEDYLVVPRVLGGAVGLSPLIVLVSVAAMGILFGGLGVLLAIPFAAVLATLIDVIVRDRDPAEEEVPSVLFAGKDTEP
jgi:predicted PurR-regulated permease PerM